LGSGVGYNDNPALEREADAMGAKALIRRETGSGGAPGGAKPAPRGGPVQAKKILVNGVWVDAPEGLRRRNVPGSQPEAPEPSGPMAPPGRPYMATHDAPSAHGATSWASAFGQFVTGTVDPVAARNATEEARTHVARSNAEKRNGETRNSAISAAQALVAGGQIATATPLIHHLIPVPGAGDALWYSAKAMNLKLQKGKTKQKLD
jgi:hypothetical protein